MSSSLQRPSHIVSQSHLPSIKDLSVQWNTPIDDGNLDLPPIREPLVKESTQISESAGGNGHPTRATSSDKPSAGCWPSELPPQRGPTLVFPDDDDEEEGEQEGDTEGKDSGKDDGDDDEPRQCPPLMEQTQSASQPRLLPPPDSRPILRLSPKSLAEGGPELEAQQHSLLHQYRLPSSSSTDEPTSAPPAYVYQTPTAPQPSSGPVPFSYNVLRAQQGDLVNVRTPSARAQGILRPTAIIEDEDESHKRYRCDWPNCGKKYDRPSSLEVHKYSHTRQQPFPCPESDCSRAFSVKSNMLRHFRSHPKRAGMSAADVSAASAKKAATIHAALERDTVQIPKGKEKGKGKGKEKEVEPNGEMQNKANNKAKSSAVTSISSRKLPILTLTPAPTALPSTSTTHPGTRSRTTLDTELIASLSLSVANVLEVNASEDSRAVSLPIPISPSASPSPSPLLSPQSTCSSAPTSASIMSMSLLSPSFASTSAPASVAFSPPSELLSPHSIYSPNSPYSAQSPHSPPVSTASETEKDSQKESEEGSEPSLHAIPDSEYETNLSTSNVPIVISTAAPDQTTSHTVLARSPSPERLQSSSSAARSPSPCSPQFRTQTLYPVSDTRSSPREGFLPSASPNHTRGKGLIDTQIVLGTSRLNSPPRSMSPGLSSSVPKARGPFHRADKRKKAAVDNSDNDAEQDHGSFRRTDKQTSISHKGVSEKPQSESATMKEKVSEEGCWPAPPRPAVSFQKTFVSTMQPESSAAKDKVSEEGCWPEPPRPAVNFQRAFVGTMQPESSAMKENVSKQDRRPTPSNPVVDPQRALVGMMQAGSGTTVKEVIGQTSPLLPSASKPAGDVHEVSENASSAEPSVITKPSFPLHSTTPGSRSASPVEMFSFRVLKVHSSSSHHSNKRRRIESGMNDDRAKNSADQDHRSAIVPHGRATDTDCEIWPPPPKPTRDLQNFLVNNLSTDSSSRTSDRSKSPFISESHSLHHLSTKGTSVSNAGDDGAGGTSEGTSRPSTSKRIDDRSRDVIETLAQRSASPASKTSHFVPVFTKRPLSTSHVLESEAHLRSVPHSDDGESQQDKGFWPKDPAPQTRDFFKARWFEDEVEGEEDPGGGGGGGNEMEVEEVNEGKKQAALAFDPMGLKRMET